MQLTDPMIAHILMRIMALSTKIDSVANFYNGGYLITVDDEKHVYRHEYKIFDLDFYIDEYRYTGKFKAPFDGCYALRCCIVDAGLDFVVNYDLHYFDEKFDDIGETIPGTQYDEGITLTGLTDAGRKDLNEYFLLWRLRGVIN